MFRFAGRRGLFTLGLLLAVVSLAMTQQSQPKAERGLAEGKLWFTQYCAPCHGNDAKGHGPVVPALKEPPPDLTTLAKRNNGKFPADYLKKVLTHGVTAPAHGTSEMPIWGPTFAGINEGRLIQYLESVQVK